MNNKLFIVPKTPHLTCVWVPTGDPRTPLARLWVHDSSSCTRQEGDLCLCA